MLKTCRKCGEEKDQSMFSPDKKNKDGLHSYCRQCLNKIIRDKRNSNKEAHKAYRRKTDLKYLYGLDYDPITPESKCAVCGSTSRLHIDHDHTTGKFRGVLCHNCNTALGLVHEDISTLTNLINYLGGNN